MQDGSSARAQRPRRLMTVQFTRQIAWNTSVGSPDSLKVMMPSLDSCVGELAATATAAEAQCHWYDEALVLPHE